MQTLKKAYGIAVKSLRGSYREKGIYAGKHHFNDYWARDSFFASLGCLELKDFAVVKKNLGLFLKFQGRDGQIPLRVGCSRLELVLKVFGIKVKGGVLPRYSQDKGFNKPTDQNSLLIISFYSYVKETNDLDFLEENLVKLEKCIEWNQKQDIDNDLLMEEGEYASWADNIRKKGKVLYTNVCHCHALFCLSEVFGIKGDRKNKEKYYDLFIKTRKRLNEVFWKASYYYDWIDKKRYDYFSTDGNLLAVVWDIADKEKSQKIEKSLEELGINKFVPSLTNMPDYPYGKASSIFLRFIRLGDYQDRICWLWLGCMDAAAKYKIGMKKEAFDILGRISDVIVKFNDVYEVYERSGKPVNRLVYKSEYNFTWSAGLFVFAYHYMKCQKAVL